MLTLHTLYKNRSQDMKTLNSLKLILISFLTITFLACNEDSNETIEQLENPRITVKLVDAPGDFDSVFIDVVDLMVKYGEDDGWQSLNPINTGVYDLLDLTGGVNILLVDDFQIPAGDLGQIRLVLGDDNTIVIDGETYPLMTPSAQQSGLKLQVNETLEQGFTYSFILDFDVDESIVVAGNSGNIILKPVLHVSTEVSSGKIEGVVNPTGFQVLASVEIEGGEITAYADENGAFVLNGVPEGSYTVTFTPDEGFGYEVTTVENVQVLNGQTTNIGTVNLIETPVFGSISGTVTNESISATASVEVDGNIVEASTNETGVFLLENIPIGTYVVTVVPEEGSGFETLQFENVEVTEGNVTDLGDITFN